MKKKLLLLFLLTATTLMAQPAPSVQVDVQVFPSGVPESCAVAQVYYPHLKRTTDYIVDDITYSPLALNIGGAQTMAINNDDIWSPEITLPFTFCFYDQPYDKLKIGTNGVITFDSTNQLPGATCPYQFNTPIPNADFPIKNAIYGVYQDNALLNVAGASIKYLQIGTAPNRRFIINFTEARQFGCGASVGLQTSQIVLYETSNYIDVYVAKRTPCTAVNNGNGVIGIQNMDGTQAVFPAQRNTGAWSATNEAWRFIPNGVNATHLTWTIDGIPIGFGDDAYICSSNPYQAFIVATVTFDGCADGNPLVLSDFYDGPLLVIYPLGEPVDFTLCSDELPPYFVDLTENEPVMLSGIPQPSAFVFTYYENYQQALSFSGEIQNPAQYSFSMGHPIYVNIYNTLTGIFNIKVFNVTIDPRTPPDGNENQNFTSGQTLADLAVSGTNLVWYDAAEDGNVFVSSTALQDGVTYYVSQNPHGCESRRLAVTVQLNLATNQFAADGFRVYPNPAQDNLNISATDVLQSVTFFNAIGQQVLVLHPQKREVNVDISGISRGVYFVTMVLDERQQTFKIVKQ